MAQTLKTLLVAACLVSLRPVLAASEEDTDGAVAVAEPRYVTHNEKGAPSDTMAKIEKGLPIALHGVVIVALVIFFRDLVLGIDARLPGDEETEIETELEFGNLGFERHDHPPYPYPGHVPSRPGRYKYNGGRPGRRRTGRDTQGSLLSHFVESIDPVDATFSLLQVNDKACRRRVVCELQRSASTMPIIGSFLQQISSSISGLQEYREAQEAGAALQDCSLLFAECPADALIGDY